MPSKFSNYRTPSTLEVISLYAEGLSTRDIAAKLGCGRTTVQRRLLEAGLRCRPRRDYKHKYTGKASGRYRKDLSDHEIAKLYAMGLSTIAIAQQLGCHSSTVWRRLKHTGNRLRPVNSSRCKIPTVQIAALRMQGLTSADIAQRLDCARSTITQRLHKLGLNRRYRWKQS